MFDKEIENHLKESIESEEFKTKLEATYLTYIESIKKNENGAVSATAEEFKDEYKKGFIEGFREGYTETVVNKIKKLIDSKMADEKIIEILSISKEDFEAAKTWEKPTNENSTQD